MYRTVLLALALSLAAHTAAAQTDIDKVAEPVVGQPGKDVIWVPTPPELIDKMMTLGGVTANDYVIDLGSGDGRLVIAAAKRGATALGVEYDDKLYAASLRAARDANVQDKATFVQGDMYLADISKATALTLFLLPSNLQTLTPKFVALRPGTRIVINTFEIPNWSPDKTETLELCDPWCTAHLWIVPANAGGKWRIGDSVLDLQQTFQVVAGTLTRDGRETRAAGKLTGDQIAFTVDNTEYSGRVLGDRMEGRSVSGGKEVTWTATRLK